jgi:hypothetical protein
MVVVAAATAAGEAMGTTGPVWVVGTLEKGCRRVNMVQILYTHVCKWKNETCWNYSRNGGGGIKENDGRGELSYDIFDIL